ncbi:calcium-binding protein [Pseudaestuariivita atlantica]|uniref:calcium-binding protein n=1 Tax=Pseudaestuariivita atlantica TaxID=1317121 RepID=UPI00067C4065|nr:M10 family metallopeptidase C-terminal domain-containing protein [Pseudaestuariivita atlantica]
MATFVEGTDLPDDISTPLTLAPGDVLNGTLDAGGDRDFVGLVIEPRMTYTVNLSERGGSGVDTYLRGVLFNGLTVIENDDIIGSLNSSFTFTSSTTSTFFLSAGSFNDASVGNYALEIIATPVEPSGGPDTEAVLYLGEDVTGTVSVDGTPDDDVYAVELFAGRTYQFDAGNIDMANDLAVLLYQSDWTGVLSDWIARDVGSAGGSPSIQYTPTATTSFYVAVIRDQGGGPVDYSLSFIDIGADAWFGTAGDDMIGGAPGAFYGFEGDDTIMASSGMQQIDGGDGIDTVSFANSTTRVSVDLQNTRFNFGDGVDKEYLHVEVFQGSDVVDALRGDAGINTFFGGGFSDRLYGRAGDDVLNGEGGADALYGNIGADIMTGGGDPAQRDRFIYFSPLDSGIGEGERDVITDFVSGVDRIEIGRIDADVTVGRNQAFDFIGSADFTGVAGQLRYRLDDRGNTIIEADTNGDAFTDFEIELTGEVMLAAGDFLL